MVFLKVRSNQSAEGFTLIEILVAMILLAISLTVILQLFAGGLKSIGLSDNYSRGIYHAREKMEELLLVREFSDTSLSGDFEDGYRWQADIKSVVLQEILGYRETKTDETASDDESEAEKEDTNALFLFNVAVKVLWQDGNHQKQFAISTLALKKKLAQDDEDALPGAAQ